MRMEDPKHWALLAAAGMKMALRVLEVAGGHLASRISTWSCRCFLLLVLTLELGAHDPREKLSAVQRTLGAVSARANRRNPSDGSSGFAQAGEEIPEAASYGLERSQRISRMRSGVGCGSREGASFPRVGKVATSSKGCRSAVAGHPSMEHLKAVDAVM